MHGLGKDEWLGEGGGSYFTGSETLTNCTIVQKYFETIPPDCISFADIILAVTFWYGGQPIYSIVTLLLVLVPNAIVQIFSARWNKIDETFSWPVAIVHSLLLGTLHR